MRKKRGNPKIAPKWGAKRAASLSSIQNVNCRPTPISRDLPITAKS